MAWDITAKHNTNTTIKPNRTNGNNQTASIFRQYMKSKFTITPANLSNYFRGLTNAGILKKLGNNVYIYNPHIFYYADEKVADEMRENFVCEFDDLNLKIKINSIKTYFNFK